MAKKLLRITEDEFYEQFNPVKNHIDPNAAFDGCMFETYGDEVEYVSKIAESDEKNKVWTIIEVEGKFYYCSGWQFVNRFGYLITEESVPEDIEYEILLDDEIIPEAQFSEEIVVIDPDTKGEVHLSVFKHPNGGMFAIDSSYLEQEFEDDLDPCIPDPLEKEGNPVIILKGV